MSAKQLSPPTKVLGWHQHVPANTWGLQGIFQVEEMRADHGLPQCAASAGAWQKEGWTPDMHEKCVLMWLWTSRVNDVRTCWYCILAYLNHKERLFQLSLIFSLLVTHFEPVREVVEMVLGSACSFHIKHMVNLFTPSLQTSAELSIPSSNLSKMSTNTHFLNPLQFYCTSITSSSFWHSLEWSSFFT